MFFLVASLVNLLPISSRYPLDTVLFVGKIDHGGKQALFYQ